MIVPTYQRAALLPETLRSLIAQTRAPAEIIVVDDGSTEDAEGAARGVGGPVRYLRQENAGKSAALNRGLRAARGAYVWVFDDDDLALPGAAEALAGALDAGADGFAFGRYRRFREEADGRRTELGPGYWPAAPEPVLDALLDDFHVFQPACMVRRDAFEAVGPFREDMLRAQDYEMAIRLARRYRGVFMDADVFLQREHAGARGTGADRFDAARSFEKWIAYGAALFRALRAEMDLMEWAPEPEAPAPLRRRGAFLRRGAAMARRHLWAEAAEDFTAAAALADAAGPTVAERDALGRAFAGKYDCRDVAERPELARDLRDALGNALWGASARRALARPLVWRAREALGAGDPVLSARHFRALAILAGGPGAAAMTAGRAGARLRRSAAAGF